jgi:DNA helicase-2/ATP-dependent DNA helicase PcrA
MSTEFRPSDEQLSIIEYSYEPLRIAAGAGTGKTTTIVERIAHLVGAGLDPARILGVTFTNKAAEELNQRVLQVLGSEHDDRTPEISTYHGFAASILDEFGAYVGYDRSAMLMDDGHRSELASRVLRSTGTPDLDLTSLSTRRSEMLSLAASLTDNLIDAAVVRAAAPSGVRAANLDTADDETVVWRKRLALADAAESYEAEKRRIGLLEYSDLIRLAVQVVEESDDVSNEISSRYDAVVLDEYQDTDPAQRRLLTSLFARRVPVMAVGDTDQTIYEWRGASAENFAAFPHDFPIDDGTDSSTLPLSENRRSDRVILDLANRIRDELPHVEGARALTPVSDVGQGELVASWFDTEQSEAAWIASEILEHHGRGASWNDIAVLCRKRSHFGPIVAALDVEGIPYSVGSMGQLLEVPEVADLLAWLRIVQNPADEVSLLRILLGARFRIGMTAIAKLRQWCRHEDGTSLFDASQNTGHIDGLSDEARSRITAFVALHEELVRKSQVVGVAAIVDAIIDALGYWDEIAALEPGPGLTAQLNIGRFTDLAQQWRPLEGSPSLGGFLRYLAALAESGRADELASAAPLHADAVSILTVHASKGLEWPHVYLPAVADQVFPARSQAHDDPDRIARLLPYDLRLDSTIHVDVAAASSKERAEILKRRHLHQEWRLAYVAATRAAHRLVVSGHGWDGTVKKGRKPSPLWLMASVTPGSQIGVIEPVSETPPGIEIYVEPDPAPDPLFPLGPQAALRRTVSDPEWIEEEYPELAAAVAERVAQLELAVEDLATPRIVQEQQRFVVSVTNLVALASCPQRFKWIHHDRLPRRPRSSAVFGTAFHRRIELHNLGVIAFEDQVAGHYDSVANGDTEPSGQAPSDPWKLFEQSRFADETPIHIEAPFEIEVGTGSIRGKVDAIYKSGQRDWEIVDYKSGRYRDDPARKVQLEAYAIAAADGALSTHPPDTIDVTFAYFGDDELVEVTESVDKEWLFRARNHVEALVDQGLNGPYEPSPSDDCRWCDFLHLCPAGQQAVKDSQTT